MKIVHIISGFQKINFGIWNAALIGSSYLKNRYGIDSVMLVCSIESTNTISIDLPVYWIGSKPKEQRVFKILQGKNLLANNTLIVTHGCWLYPTKIGCQLRKIGYSWIAVPHGMLEPWSLSNGKVKKLIFFSLFERRRLKYADAIRAVSNIEKNNLGKLLNQPIITVENGVNIPTRIEKKNNSIQYLFMARLHAKKGILPLVKAWSEVMKNSGEKLVIAGPDEGELPKITPYLNRQIVYVGAVYGADKINLLCDSHYYLLPSFSEGFPTSVLEAMSFGLIPLISSGCNFPEVFLNDLGQLIEPDSKNIMQQLSLLKNMPFDFEKSKRNQVFIEENFSEESIALKLYSMYNLVFQNRGINRN